MEFLKSVLFGLLFIWLLLFITGSQDQRGFEGIGQAMVLIFIAPVILLFSIIIGIKRQSLEQKTMSGDKSYTFFGIKGGKGFYLSILTILILCIIFIILYSPYFLTYLRQL